MLTDAEQHGAFPHIGKVMLNFEPIHLLPGLNGLELAVAVRRRWPAIKIMITSGHCHIQNEDLPVIGRFFRKPYDPLHVANALREMTSAA